MNKTYSLFSCCIPVKGFKRSIIIDIQREEFRFIPNALYEILKKNIDVENIVKKVCKKSEDYAIIFEYINFLIEHEFVYEVLESYKYCFPKISKAWQSPYKITNSIVDLDFISTSDLKKILDQLNLTNCFNLQLRFNSSIAYDDLVEIIELVLKFNFRMLQILIPNSNLQINKNNKKLITDYPIIQSLILHSSNLNKVDINKKTSNHIIYTKDVIIPKNDCGKVAPNYFTLNDRHFTESQHFNTCLNRKICVDSNGEIKNCPSMNRSFGNIKDTTLEEALNKPGFKDLWGIRKDDIDVCKDCEFRYMCTDCRAFIKKPDDVYSQPAKCPYNPYIALWEGQEGYITVEEWRNLNPNWEKGLKRYPHVKNPQKVE